MVFAKLILIWLLINALAAVLVAANRQRDAPEERHKKGPAVENTGPVTESG
jgi:hypothetical protein